jgi:ubiquinone/menaquinone biosynthesis C-methylase UbiE
MECLLAGRVLQRCRTAFLEQTLHATAALLIGAGNGRFLTEFLKVNKTASVVCLDASSRMLEFARRRTAGSAGDRVRFVQADLLDPPHSPWEAGPFDIVVTHFFLDCFRPEQLEPIVTAIAGQTSPGARWLLADFRVPTGALARIRAKTILWLAYAFFRIATRLPAKQITPPDSFLKRNGFALQKRRVYECGLLHSDLWRAL